MSYTDMAIKIRIWDCFVIADFTVKSHLTMLFFAYGIKTDIGNIQCIQNIPKHKTLDHASF